MTTKAQVLNILQDKFQGDTFKRKDIIQAILDINRPGTTYNNEEHRGIYSSALNDGIGKWGVNYNNGYYLRPGRKDKRHLQKIKHGTYIIIR